MIEGTAAKQWAKVEGKVSEAVIETTTQHGAQNRYSARLDYKYVFNGVVRRARLPLRGGSNTSRAYVVREASGFSAGQTIDVFVDPRRPHKSRLEAGISHHDVGGVICGVALIAASLWLIFR